MATQPQGFRLSPKTEAHSVFKMSCSTTPGGKQKRLELASFLTECERTNQKANLGSFSIRNSDFPSKKLRDFAYFFWSRSLYFQFLISLALLHTVIGSLS